MRARQHRQGLRARAAAAWPHLRALFIGFHILALIALSLPSPHNLINPAAWNSKGNQESIAVWAERVVWLGYDSERELESDLWALATAYVDVREQYIAPFATYARHTGAQQGWRMFAVPQRHPAELHVDAFEHSRWRPLYRPRSDQHDWWGGRLRHNRVRKLQGRLARGAGNRGYDHWARFLASRAVRDFPAADAIRIRLYRYSTRTPAVVRAGRAVDGRYERERIYDRTIRRLGPARAPRPADSGARGRPGAAPWAPKETP